ncbi:hypothetical protein [Ruegeria sp. MALMAid1280]|uniref:hypothetical protein n=1 Tax=Ruegeria sp. MALMAid1280 TaxID=3411634 RepID=UPI003BA3526E
MSIGYSVGSFYHPMPARGDLIFPIKASAVLVPTITAASIFLLWLMKRPLPRTMYFVGLLVLAVGCLLPLAPRLESGYKQTYWVMDQPHEIPWNYGPYNGQIERGGTYFLVKVSGPDWQPIYKSSGEEIIFGKASDFNFGEGGNAPTEICLPAEYRFRCQLKRGSFVYFASANVDLFPKDPLRFMSSAADLLDGFEIEIN